MNEQISHHELKSCPGCATLDVLTRKSPDFIIFKARHKRQILLSYFFHSSWPLTTLPLLGSGWDLLFPSCWTKMLWWEIWKNPLFSPSPSVRILSSATQPPRPPKCWQHQMFAYWKFSEIEFCHYLLHKWRCTEQQGRSGFYFTELWKKSGFIQEKPSMLLHCLSLLQQKNDLPESSR